MSVAATVGWAAVCELAGVAAALAGTRAARGCRGGSGDDDGGADAYLSLGSDGSQPPAVVTVVAAEPLLSLHPVPSEASLVSLAAPESSSAASFASSPVLRAAVVSDGGGSSALGRGYGVGGGHTGGDSASTADDPVGFR